ncbi:uncharacterized mitochondrial protein AtMg00810-like [Vicia villosa]|uniref:uncharacterized mitochondrial protein AtMg00810-like n=1 Tax=Vicia villosa TaxID=3911 RepID=UPI00273C34B4|nr:uncharacterized mitochondrial protein AtMg00810-like [Vicia villosa]
MTQPPGFVTSDKSLVCISLHALVYVDDILIIGSSSAHIHELIIKLHHKFALKKLGRPSYFLGIEVKFQSNGSLLLTQTKYIKYLLSRAKMDGANGVPTPMLGTCRLSKHGTNYFADPQLYRSIVGALQYVTLTRPDISFSVNKACQFMASPLDTHWAAVRRILRYLICIVDCGLLLSHSVAGSKFFVRAYSDSNWASDPD